MVSEIPQAQPPPEVAPRPLWWRFRRNPLRRPTDLLRAWIGVALLLALLVMTPTVMLLVGNATYRDLQRTAEHEARTLHRIPAVLEHEAPRHPEPGSDEALKAMYPVMVRFTAPDGRARTAKTDVEPGLPAGTRVHVWVTDDGTLTEPPLTARQVRDNAIGWALLAAMAAALISAGAYGAVRRRLERRNLADWDAAWAKTAPRWTRST
ncbi:Rv1733c family protein [Streptomyces sp. NPDC001020]